ncbi:hypothetical protein [Mucilaginibacter lappiensis]|uniref:Uncharacterized protein n=1 Tax=Mucilaginibacter lappiensis TaxID=354630 RepID=A0A841J8D2_9SPHI|nr:hypothetical protein [Mucilaginibacter lappiensis]MBB6126974.1 hypothetical protein [Mucilaginibacter lappiensis]
MNNLKQTLRVLRSKMKLLAIQHTEYIGITVALLLLLIFPPIIRLYDPTAAPIDAGALSGILLAVVSVLIFLSVTWWFIRAIWPVFAEYSNTDFTTDFKNLQPWQKIKIYMGFYSFVVLAFLAALVAIL